MVDSRRRCQWCRHGAGAAPTRAPGRRRHVHGGTAHLRDQVLRLSAGRGGLSKVLQVLSQQLLLFLCHRLFGLLLLALAPALLLPLSLAPLLLLLLLVDAAAQD